MFTRGLDVCRSIAEKRSTKTGIQHCGCSSAGWVLGYGQQETIQNQRSLNIADVRQWAVVWGMESRTLTKHSGHSPLIRQWAEFCDMVGRNLPTHSEHATWLMIVSGLGLGWILCFGCFLYTSPSPRDLSTPLLPSSVGKKKTIT